MAIFFTNTSPSFKPIKTQQKLETQHTDAMSSGNKNYNYQNLVKGIGTQESDNNYGALGKMIIKGSNKNTRAWGKYQFMPKTLRGLGITAGRDQFLNNPKLQDRALKMLTTQNARALNIDLDNMNKRQYKALSMAHYSGIGNARKFYNSGLNKNLLKPQMTTGQTNPSISNYANSVLQKSGEYKENFPSMPLGPIAKPISEFLYDATTGVPKTLKYIKSTIKTKRDFDKLSPLEKNILIEKFRSEVNNNRMRNLLIAAGLSSSVPIATTIAIPNTDRSKLVLIVPAIAASLAVSGFSIKNFKNNKKAINDYSDKQIIALIKTYLH